MSMIPGMPYLEYASDALPTRDSIWGKLGRLGGTFSGLTELGVHGLRRRAKLTRAHFQEHAFSYVAVSCIDAAFFTHSVFAGLLSTGIGFVLLEWKASDEPQQRSE